MRPLNKLSYPTLTVLAFLFICALYLFALSGQLKPTPDSSDYIGSGYSLASGNGYTFNNERSYYPPFNAITLAVITKITMCLGLQSFIYLFMKIAMLGWLFLLALGTFVLAQRYLSKQLAVVATLLLLINITIFQHVQYILSDMLYSCLGIWAIIFFQKTTTLKFWIWGVILAALALITRSVGVLLIVAIILWTISGKHAALPLQKRLRRSFLLLPFSFIPYICWKVYLPTTQTSYVEYIRLYTGKDEIIDIISARLIEQFPIVVTRLSQIMLNIESTTLPMAFNGTIVFLLLVAWSIYMVQKRSLAEYYVACYLAIMCVWFEQGTRFYIPILPILLIYVVGIVEKGITQFNQTTTKRQCIYSFMILVAILPLVYPMKTLIDNDSPLSPLAITRNGMLYPMLTVFMVVVLTIAYTLRINRSRIRTLSLYAYPLLYGGLFFLYATIFGLLEHRIVESRQPMLTGYMPYYEIGERLNNKNIPEPMLAANASIVHLSSQKIVKCPEMYPQATIDQINNGTYATMLVIEALRIGDINKDLHNQFIQQQIALNPDRYELIATIDGNNKFKCYRYTHVK